MVMARRSVAMLGSWRSAAIGAAAGGAARRLGSTAALSRHWACSISAARFSRRLLRARRKAVRAEKPRCIRAPKAMSNTELPSGSMSSSVSTRRAPDGAALAFPGAGCGMRGMVTLPRPMAIQNRASVGVAMMMANRIAVTGWGFSPVARTARLENMVPARPPSPVGSGQLWGAAMKAKTPQVSRLAATQARARRPMRDGTRSRTRLQAQRAGGTRTASMPMPKSWKLMSAITAPGKPSQFCGGLLVA